MYYLQQAPALGTVFWLQKIEFCINIKTRIEVKKKKKKKKKIMKIIIHDIEKFRNFILLISRRHYRDLPVLKLPVVQTEYDGKSNVKNRYKSILYIRVHRGK